MEVHHHFNLVLPQQAKPYSMRIAQFLIKGMGMPYTIISRDQRYPNGSASAIVRMLDRGEADAAVVLIPAGPLGGSMQLGYSFPLAITSVAFASRKYQADRELFSIFDPFSFQVWLSVILLSIFMTLVLCVLMQKSCKLSDILKKIISSILGKSVTFKYRNEKLLMFSWILGVMFLINCYLSLLLSAVTVPRRYVIRNTTQLSKEVEDGRYQVTSANVEIKIMLSQSKQQKSLRIVGNRTKLLPSSYKSILDIVQKSKNSKLAYLANRYHLNCLDNDFYISDDNFYFVFNSLPVSKKFCCREKLNRVVHRIRETGLIMKGEASTLWKLKIKLFSSENITEDAVKPLALKNLSGAFVILVCGHCAALLFLVVEMLIPRVARVRNRHPISRSSLIGNQSGPIISLGHQYAGDNLVSSSSDFQSQTLEMLMKQYEDIREIP